MSPRPGPEERIRCRAVAEQTTEQSGSSAGQTRLSGPKHEASLDRAQAEDWMLSILEPPLCSDLRELCSGEAGWGSGFTSGGHRAGLPHSPT